MSVYASQEETKVTHVLREGNAGRSGMRSPKTTATVVVCLVALVKQFVDVLKLRVRNVVDLNNKAE